MTIYFKNQMSILTIIVLWFSTISPVYASSINHNDHMSSQVNMNQSVNNHSDQSQKMSKMTGSCKCTDNCSLFCEMCDQACSQSHSNPFLSFTDIDSSISTIQEHINSVFSNRNIISINTVIFRPPIR